MCCRSEDCGTKKELKCIEQFEHLRECWGQEKDADLLERYLGHLKELAGIVEARLAEIRNG